jgi:hypothetical protein
MHHEMLVTLGMGAHSASQLRCAEIIPYLRKKEKRQDQKLGIDKTPDFWYNIIESDRNKSSFKYTL